MSGGGLIETAKRALSLGGFAVQMTEEDGCDGCYHTFAAAVAGGRSVRCATARKVDL